MSDVRPDRSGLDRLNALVASGHCALLVQEVQQGVVGSEALLGDLAEAGRRVGLIGQVALVTRGARLAGVPVVHCTAENLPGGFGTNRNARLFAAARKVGLENTPGTSSVQPVPEVGPEAGDLVLPRYHGLSPLNGSPLNQLLRNEGLTTVVVVGVSLNLAIPNLVFDAVNLGFQAVVVSDAVVGVPVEYGEQVLEHTLSLVATLCTTDEILAVWAS